MGKIGRQRKKYHLAASRSESNTEKPTKPEASAQTSIVNAVKNLQVPPVDNIFKGVSIDPTSLKKQLEEFDAKSIISARSTGSQISKKDKRMLKKELFLKNCTEITFLNLEIEFIKEAEKEAKERNKRKMTPVVGDMKPLEDALPTLDMLLRDLEAAREKKKQMKTLKPRGCRSFHAQQQAMLKDIATFQQILNDPTFKADPEGTVKSHIQNTISEEKMDT